ncbi:MFS transporter [Rhodococcus sp. ACPA4]|uniref:MFS transporter n=1 Tax=Rhodococcus sp. ACPA4 TaxID=2028571 RepID=UPI000BB150AE|nr:MFS transporter [Rhodococcus sp. ACPA4]PBC35986.1 MFS transporter [Rhodococcus sp. ACPA4]
MTLTYQEVVDEVPVRRFHRKLLIACCGGPFLDGYIISIVGVAIIGLGADLDLSSWDIGLVGAAALIGIGVGALFFGSVTDRIGREKMYAIDLTVLVVACMLCAFVTEMWQIVVLRLILGLAIGADLPIATSLLTEFAPTKKRGTMLAFAAVAWGVGTAVAYLVGYLFAEFANGYEDWRWMLASGAVFGAIIVFLRRGIPESPRWLASRGRIEEAQAVVLNIYGKQIPASAFDTASKQTVANNAGLWARTRVLFSPRYVRRTIMCAVLYFANVTPQYAIFIFAPVLLTSFGLVGGSAELLGGLVIALVSIAGIIPVLRWMETVGRRKMALIPMTIMMIPFTLLWLFPAGPAWFVIAMFAIYALSVAGPGTLIWSYPNEIFPTEVRATALGFCIAFSRVGAVAGTYLLPVGIEHWGVGSIMLIAALLTLLAIVVCYFWAPEVKGMELEEAAA